MNTNDLPPAAKLAALIEAGVAANPDLTQGFGALLDEDRACALGFACLALGVPREKLNPIEYPDALRSMCSSELRGAVFFMNDSGASIPEIVTSLREGELAKVAA